MGRGQRRRPLWRLSVALVMLAGLVLAGALLLKGRGLSARRDPWPMETTVARAAWAFLVPAEVRARVNPVADTPDVRRSGLEHWADHCASCHANDGSGETTVGRNMFPPAPDMRLAATQARSDGELFYAIEHGIPWTGMPAWSNGTEGGERSTWELVRFIRLLSTLTPEDLAVMERLNPRSVADEARDREIDDFLKGPAPAAAGSGS